MNDGNREIRWHQISPSFRGDKLLSGRIEDRIDVYEDRVSGWLIKPACALTAIPNSGFAVLTLALTYFEGYATYRNGTDSKDQSKKYFHEAYLEVFFHAKAAPGHEDVPITDDLHGRIADIMYEDGRCGQFHDGMCRKRVLISSAATAPVSASVYEDATISCVVVNPALFLANIEAHHVQYVGELRDSANVELRAKFSRAWVLKNPDEVLPVPNGPIP
jgi:hypothetical protein